jgi:hypothetical protein
MGAPFCVQCGSPLSGGRFCGRCGALAESEPGEADRVAAEVDAAASQGAGPDVLVALEEDANRAPVAASAEPTGSAELADDERSNGGVTDAALASAPDATATTAVLEAWPQAAPAGSALPLPSKYGPDGTVARKASGSSSLRSRRTLAVGIGLLLVLVVGGIVVVATGVLRAARNSQPSRAAFAAELAPQLDMLTDADRAAAAALVQPLTRGTKAEIGADGGALKREASALSASLNASSGGSSEEIQRVVALVRAEERYGDALLAYAAGNGSLEGVRAAARAGTLEAMALSDVLPDLSTPLFAPLGRAATATPAPPPRERPAATPRPGQPTPAQVYVRRVDALLGSSAQTLAQVKAFAPAVAGGSLEPASALAHADGFVRERQQALQAAENLEPPAEFAAAHQLLVESLRVSLVDDRALHAWVQALAAGAPGQPQLDRVNQLGAQATALKRSFLSLYVRVRKHATGKSPASLPSSY